MANLSFTKTFVDGVALPASDLNTLQSDVSSYINARNGAGTAWDGLKSTSASVVPGTFDNSSGTQNILECKDNGSTVLSVADGGAVAITGSLTVNGSTVSGSAGDGWNSVSETWIYASATTFTISGDKTSTYSVGDKIKLTQTTAKYFYVTGVSYSAPNTTITVNAGSVYSLANAAITSPTFSKGASPNGFPTYFTFTPSGVVGFSGSPTVEGYFSMYGRFLTIAYHFNGTSNSVDLTATVPFTVTTTLSVAITTPSGQGVNNGTFLSTAHAYLSGSTLTCVPSNGGAWTASGSKQCTGFVYGIV